MLAAPGAGSRPGSRRHRRPSGTAAPPPPYRRTAVPPRRPSRAAPAAPPQPCRPSRAAPAAPPQPYRPSRAAPAAPPRRPRGTAGLQRAHDRNWRSPHARSQLAVRHAAIHLAHARHVRQPAPPMAINEPKIGDCGATRAPTIRDQGWAGRRGRAAGPGGGAGRRGRAAGPGGGGRRAGGRASAQKPSLRSCLGLRCQSLATFTCRSR